MTLFWLIIGSLILFLYFWISVLSNRIFMRSLKGFQGAIRGVRGEK